MVNLPPMWKILETYGMPNKITRILPILYEGSESCVRVGLEHTKLFVVDSGVRQDDSLSAFLLNLVQDLAMTRLETEDGGIDWIGG